MGWAARKLCKSDWAYPIDYEAYFEARRIEKEMDEWYQLELQKARRAEWDKTWSEYIQSKGVIDDERGAW